LFYLSTYYAMGAAFYFTLWEAVASVLVPDFFDIYMVRGFNIMLTVTIIFGGFAICSGILLLWRVNGSQKHQVSILRIIWNEVRGAQEPPDRARGSFIAHCGVWLVALAQ
jgi:hypothetical protein